MSVPRASFVVNYLPYNDLPEEPFKQFKQYYDILAVAYSLLIFQTEQIITGEEGGKNPQQDQQQITKINMS